MATHGAHVAPLPPLFNPSAGLRFTLRAVAVLFVLWAVGFIAGIGGFDVLPSGPDIRFNVRAWVESDGLILASGILAIAALLGKTIAVLRTDGRG